MSRRQRRKGHVDSQIVMFPPQLPLQHKPHNQPMTVGEVKTTPVTPPAPVVPPASVAAKLSRLDRKEVRRLEDYLLGIKDRIMVARPPRNVLATECSDKLGVWVSANNVNAALETIGIEYKAKRDPATAGSRSQHRGSLQIVCKQLQDILQELGVKPNADFSQLAQSLVAEKPPARE